MNRQITFRLPVALARALAKRARASGLPQSHLVREALQAYLTDSVSTATLSAGATAKRFRGILDVDPRAAEQDALARRVFEHNWRE